MSQSVDRDALHPVEVATTAGVPDVTARAAIDHEVGCLVQRGAQVGLIVRVGDHLPRSFWFNLRVEGAAPVPNSVDTNCKGAVRADGWYVRYQICEIVGLQVPGG
ncbi:hypothetical protein SDC9_111181 [bioreactor metagenome]|uniref:Uncharacterized protein n=1 Tax=bioreactor metagenome TaxID=1076179 RepID=A0A645BFT4_9ZZZZ